MYKIILPNFQGPFDLLLYFIKRSELNIYDIPIAKLADEFLNYIKFMKHFDIEVAGEFIVMAANLIYIKTQMLLPRQKSDDGEELEDPREQLVQNILEYVQFKEAAKNLNTMVNQRKFMLNRGNLSAEYVQANIDIVYKNSTLFDILKSFARAIQRNLYKEENVHVIEIESVNIEEKKVLIKKLIQDKKRITFNEITKNISKLHIVVTFLAMLELMKNGFIFITQEDIFGDIIISEVSNIDNKE